MGKKGEREVSFHDVRDRLYSRAVIRSDAWNVRNVNERRDRQYVTCHFHSRSDQAENFILCSDCSRPIRRDGVYWIDTRSLFFSALIKSTGRYYPLDGDGLRGLLAPLDSIKNGIRGQQRGYVTWVITSSRVNIYAILDAMVQRIYILVRKTLQRRSLSISFLLSTTQQCIAWNFILQFK